MLRAKYLRANQPHHRATTIMPFSRNPVHDDHSSGNSSSTRLAAIPGHAAPPENLEREGNFHHDQQPGANDEPAADGIVYDSDRNMFLRNYLTQLQRATSEGVPVRRYFHWSLMDNFEWSAGYGTRFGLIHVDYATQKRTPKLSATYYSEVIRRNALP